MDITVHEPMPTPTITILIQDLVIQTVTDTMILIIHHIMIMTQIGTHQLGMIMTMIMGITTIAIKNKYSLMH